MTEFSIRLEQPLQILFLANSPFDNCIQAWICVVLSILRQDNYIFINVRFGSALIRWRRNVWRKPTWKWPQDVINDVKIAILTSCTRVVLHVRRHFLSCKTTFPSPGRAHGNSGRVCKNIRIFNGCEVLIENSVTRVTFRHHDVCRVMPNSYPNDGIFNLHQRTIMDSFSCIAFLRQLHLDLNTCCFINFTLK